MVKIRRGLGITIIVVLLVSIGVLALFGNVPLQQFVEQVRDAVAKQ